ncbi:hypothetical protein Phum_PHUM227590 [Pediculus humanus corporis]|uniref:Uncharacterized protein n=1 Tax=Pediculus humanus subsp. corporis TaxID=121224 RepID=E0VIH5_PEDHC|nr:uncharacterized protein Phum_PHUM227590 [Pediculus humanus corporis]EEB13181.1 hypothetical protein Phum_PHUM227590 [Pediculus humanus corporis]
MDEEVMWKTLYEKIQQEKLQERAETEHEIRIQELDNGFFEKFGTELLHKEQAKVSQSGITTTSTGQPLDGDSGVGEEITTIPSLSSSSSSSDEDDSDESDREETNKESFISDAFGWNVSYLKLFTSN